MNGRNIVQDESGLASLSGLIILCLLGMILFYMYDIYAVQMEKVTVLKAGMTARNYTVSCAELIIDHYRENDDAWLSDTAKATQAYDFAQAIVVEQMQEDDAYFKSKTMTAYMMRYTIDVYILIVESTVNGITNQVRIYLQQKDGELIVQRWER